MDTIFCLFACIGIGIANSLFKKLLLTTLLYGTGSPG